MDTPYLTLTGGLWGVYYEDFEENLPLSIGTTLYNSPYTQNTYSQYSACWGHKGIYNQQYNEGSLSIIILISQFDFDTNFNLLLIAFQLSECNKFLVMPQQLCCHGMCNNLLQSNDKELNYEWYVN